MKVPSTPEEWAAFSARVENNLAAAAWQMPPPDYPRYLRRKLWKETIKPRVLERDRHTCFRCKGLADVVHHRSYAPEVMAGDADERLVSLCEGCHETVHTDVDGRFRPWKEQEQVLATENTDRDTPPVRIDLRRIAIQLPPEWKRLNHHQRLAWQMAAAAAWKERKAQKSRGAR